jgi:hypothetical protein
MGSEFKEIGDLNGARPSGVEVWKFGTVAGAGCAGTKLAERELIWGGGGGEEC